MHIDWLHLMAQYILLNIGFDNALSLFGDKPIGVLKLNYCQMPPWKQLSVNTFHQNSVREMKFISFRLQYVYTGISIKTQHMVDMVEVVKFKFKSLYLIKASYLHLLGS